MSKFVLIVVIAFVFQRIAVGSGFSIVSSEIERDAEYARISTNTSCVVFSIQNLVEPTPHEECRLGGRRIVWRISPKPIGDVSDDGGEIFVVDFSHADDFGKSYRVSATIIWMEYDVSSGNFVGNITKSSVYTLDAILYSFTAVCSDGTVSSDGVSALVDNHPAKAMVTTEGCTRKDLLRMCIKSNPVEKNPINKVNSTAMVFSRTADTCVFTTPRTYWYGLGHPNDCFFRQYEYKLTLESDGHDVACNFQTVGWPSEHPEARLSVQSSQYRINFSDIQSYRLMVSVSNCKFIKTVSITDECPSDQYAAETMSEERYHRNQMLGIIGLSQGGCGDLFDMDRAMAECGFSGGDGNYSKTIDYNGDSDMVKANETLLIMRAIESELEQSEELYLLGRGYMEKCAKDAAAYNAAFRYHCTYGNPSRTGFLGLEETLTERTHR